MTSPLDKLLATHGRVRSEGEEEEDGNLYRSVVTRTRPQMGFAITRANGDMEGFFYHLIDNLNYQTRGGSEFLSFTHRGKAVTVQGTALRGVFQAIMRHTLAELNEPDGRAAKEGLPAIMQMEVTVVG